MTISTPKLLRIVAKGFENFTGPLGAIDFVDGVSAFPVPEPFASRLAASMEMVELNDDGTETPAGVAHRLVAEAKMRAPVHEKLEVMTEDEKKKDQLDAAKAADPEKRIYTKEELEALLEKDGVKAIREIGHLWSVKHKMAVVLIEMILEKQSQFQVDRQSRIEAAAGEAPVLPIEAEVKPVLDAEITPAEAAPEAPAENAAEAPVEKQGAE